MRRACLIALTLLAACGMNEERYNRKVSKAFCQWEERCESADFYGNFGDVKACSEAQEAQLAKLDAYYASTCVFDKKQAKACLQALGESCERAAQEFETLFLPCYQVWDCPADFIPATDTAAFF